MTRDELLARLVAHAEVDDRVLALLLGGSLGQGAGDRWSDLDLTVVVAPDHRNSFTTGARSWVERSAPLVLWYAPDPRITIFSAVTEEWLRCDLTITVPESVKGARDGFRPLLDRISVWEKLPPTMEPRAPEPARVAALVQEFIRVLGLIPVALGRGDHIVGVTGVGLQRTHLISLLIEELGLPQPPGALRVSRLLHPDDKRMLETLPGVVATRASLIAAHHAIATAFLPRARQLIERTGGRWPDAFWAATRRHLQRQLGDEWPSLH